MKWIVVMISKDGNISKSREFRGIKQALECLESAIEYVKTFQLSFKDIQSIGIQQVNEGGNNG